MFTCLDSHMITYVLWLVLTFALKRLQPNTIIEPLNKSRQPLIGFVTRHYFILHFPQNLFIIVAILWHFILSLYAKGSSLHWNELLSHLPSSAVCTFHCYNNANHFCWQFNGEIINTLHGYKTLPKYIVYVIAHLVLYLLRDEHFQLKSWKQHSIIMCPAPRISNWYLIQVLSFNVNNILHHSLIRQLKENPFLLQNWKQINVVTY